MGNGVVGERSFSRSLKRLKTPFIDLLQVITSMASIR